MVKYEQICFDQKINQKNPMKAAKLLHKMLERTCPDIHKTRLNALMAGVLSGINHHQISVTSLVRNLRENSVTSTKHDIKCMDRLIGNNKLHQERSLIYKMMTDYLIGKESHPLLPDGSKPILISDAIYRITWFKSVESRGWYWLGRVRGNVHLSLDGEHWNSCRHYMQDGSAKAKQLGNIYYSKVSRFCCNGYLHSGGGKGQGSTDIHSKIRYLLI